MKRDAIVGNLCGIFALIAIFAAVWVLGSTIWDVRWEIWQAIKDHPAATVFWTASTGFVFSFAIGIRS